MHRIGAAICWLLLALLVAGVNAPTLDYGLAYDDVAYLVERPPAWEQGWDIFFGTRQWGVGRHATLLSLDLNRTADLSPLPFHATNIAIAILATLLLFELARSIGFHIGGALLAAALFAVHPLHTDAVVSIIGRATSMAGASVLACMVLHAKGLDRSRSGLIALALLAFFGLCAKESAIVTIPLLGLYDALIAPAAGRRFNWKPYAVTTLAALSWAALNYANFATVAPIAHIDNPLAHAGALHRLFRASELLWSYAALTFWPTGLLPDRSFAVTEPSLTAGPLGLIAWLAVAAAAWLMRKRTPRLAFCSLWFPIAFAATANVAFPIGTIMAERLCFLPSAGPCLLVGLAGHSVALRSKAARLALALPAAVAVFALALVYDDRGRIWTSDEHYHEMTATLCPRSAKAHYNLGLARARAGDSDAAAHSFERSLAIYPSYSLAAYYLASIYKSSGRLDQAAAVWRSYLSHAPEDAGARSQMLYVLLELSRYEQALEQARAIYALDPDNRDSWRQLLTVEELARRAGSDVSP